MPYEMPPRPTNFALPFLYEQQDQLATVNHEQGGRFFVIEFRYNPVFCTIPATYPAGCPHYAARVSVFEVKDGEKVPVCEPFDGTYTGGRCYEDKPADIVAWALKETKE